MDAATDLELLVRSRYPLILVETLEEERLEALLSRVAASLGVPLFKWSRTRGLIREDLDQATYDTTDPLKLLAHLGAARGLYTAFDVGTDLDTDLLEAEIEAAIPLSVTMAESVHALREWASGRAVPAS